MTRLGGGPRVRVPSGRAWVPGQRRPEPPPQSVSGLCAGAAGPQAHLEMQQMQRRKCSGGPAVRGKGRLAHAGACCEARRRRAPPHIGAACGLSASPKHGLRPAHLQGSANTWVITDTAELRLQERSTRPGQARANCLRGKGADGRRAARQPRGPGRTAALHVAYPVGGSPPRAG